MVANPLGETDSEQYKTVLAGEGEYWDNFIAQLLLRSELPGSIDWRLAFTQFRYDLQWRPFCLGVPGINFRWRELAYILRTATRQPGMRVLDLGCGAGWLSLELARQGAYVTGLDISPTNLALARYMADSNTRNFPFLYQGFADMPCRLEAFGSAEYAFADLNTVELPVAAYDAVVVWDSLHHVSHLERLLEQVRRTLKPGGIFLGMDHAFATPRTEVFNRAVLPWLDDFSAWVTATDPTWLYQGVAALAHQQDWAGPAMDRDPTPVPNVAPFLAQLFKELLDIVARTQRQEALDKARAAATVQPEAATRQAESPFEDVSAERVMQVLLEGFHAERFTTVCPFIMPDLHIPRYRSEDERIFQHYLSTALINMGESAIAHEQADGQWFLFQLTPDRPTSPVPPRLLRAVSPTTAARADYIRELESVVAARSDYIRDLEMVVAARADYIGHLETEINRKNVAISSVEARLRLRERELVAARAPRLPWKRRTER